MDTRPDEAGPADGDEPRDEPRDEAAPADAEAGDQPMAGVRKRAKVISSDDDEDD